MKNALLSFFIGLGTLASAQVQVLGPYEAEYWNNIEVYETSNHIITTHYRTGLYNSRDDWPTTWSEVVFLNKSTNMVDAHFEDLEDFEYNGHDCSYLNQQPMGDALYCYYAFEDEDETKCHLLVRILRPNGTDDETKIIKTISRNEEVPMEAHFPLSRLNDQLVLTSPEVYFYQREWAERLIMGESINASVPCQIIISNNPEDWPTLMLKLGGMESLTPQFVNFDGDELTMLDVKFNSPVNTWMNEKVTGFDLGVLSSKIGEDNVASIRLNPDDVMMPTNRASVKFELNNETLSLAHLALGDEGLGVQVYSVDVQNMESLVEKFIPIPEDYLGGEDFSFTSVVSNNVSFSLAYAGNGVYNFNVENFVVRDDGGMYVVLSHVEQEKDYTVTYHDLLIMNISAAGELIWAKPLPRHHRHSYSFVSRTLALGNNDELHLFMLDDEENVAFWENGGPASGLEYEKMRDSDDGVMFHLSFNPMGEMEAESLPVNETFEDFVPTFANVAVAADGLSIYAIFNDGDDAIVIKLADQP